MRKNIVKKKNRISKMTKVILTAEAITLVFFALALSFYMGATLAICISIVLFLPFYLIFKKAEVSFNKNVRLWGNTLALSWTFGYFIMLFFNIQMKNISTVNQMFLWIASSFCLIIPCLVLEGALMKRNKGDTDKQKPYLFFSLSLLVLYFVVVIDLPAEAFLNNATEFSYTLKDELLALVALFPYFFLLCFAFSLLPAFIEDVAFTLICALNVCVYMQYMFFNRHIGQIFGGTYDWKENLAFSMASLVVWITVFVTTMVLKVILKKKADTYVLAASGMVFALLFVSFVSTVVKAPEEAYKYDSYYVSGKEQFTIGSKKNVIIFVVDAVDNSYVKEILAEDPDFFKEYNDFTLYTDTCSVYDLTSHSIPNMLLGYTYLEGKDDRAIPFLKRFRDNGYRILFYNVYAGMKADYVDNYEQISQKGDLLEVDYNKIRKDMTKLSLFQGLPCVLKGIVGIEHVSFDNYIQFGKDDYEMIGNNKLFEEHLKLSYNDKSKNGFYYFHLEGAHFPCDNPVAESKYCLSVFKEYMRQMKELGVYDDAAIIVCADHGIHDDYGDTPFPSAATPMFMVKKAGEKHDNIQISNAPVYYMDFQSTVLVASGLFNPETDYDLFGKSVFDYKEGDVRTRTWFDTDFHEEGIIRVTYTGDTSELERAIKAGEYEKVDYWAFEYEE